jgi:hypothetical protein
VQQALVVGVVLLHGHGYEQEEFASVIYEFTYTRPRNQSNSSNPTEQKAADPGSSPDTSGDEKTSSYLRHQRGPRRGGRGTATAAIGGGVGGGSKARARAGAGW